ncbi:hypothetical protein [Cellulomonas chengniuliangii]|uniref:hypothetical protein n=1 Tax=Cellulomonas chengniuliangii TaxID=2968084 RepID=UPI001D0E7322|nr:hypothetical protein [Cellulomonas chengniuliangii]MCC2317087.1 hypothetical protein [Cellulomonas chengniuliangii]
MSERRAWWPRGAVVFLALVLLAVVGVAVLRPGWLRGDREAVPADLSFRTSLLDIGEESGIRLSDDTSATQTFTVPVPLDSPLGDPVLTLRGTTQVAESSTVFLRVLADGEPVYVDELRAGDHALKVDINLPESAVEDGAVRVQVRLTGSLDQQRCNITTDLGALVELDATGTGVQGNLDERLHTVRDVVAALDHEVALVLSPEADSQEWFESAARLGAFLTQQGHAVSYAAAVPDEDSSATPVLLGPPDALADLDWDADADDGAVRVGDRGAQSLLGVVDPTADVVPLFLTTPAVTIADSRAADPRIEQIERAGGSTVSLETLGVDTSVQQITDRRSWRVPYSLADLPGGTVPTSVQLSMVVPATSDDARWLLQVRLDDELVDSVSLPGTGRQTVAVELPVGAQPVRNELVVTLVRDRDLGGCNVRQTSYDVQLLGDSALTLGGSGAGFTAVPAQYSEGFDVILPSSVLDDPVLALGGLVPTLAEFSGWRQDAGFAWDGAAGTRPFLLFGAPPPEVSPLVTLADGRITSAGVDLSSFEDGIVLQCVSAGGTPGMVLTAVGEPGDVVPDYSSERARLVPADGGGFAVSAAGQVVNPDQARAENGG